MACVGPIDPENPQWDHRRVKSFMGSAMSRLGNSDSRYLMFEDSNQRIDAIRACLTGKQWTDSGTTYDDHFDQPDSESLHELVPEGLLRALAKEHSARFHHNAVVFGGSVAKAKAAAAQVTAVRTQRAQRLAAEGPLRVAQRKLAAARRSANRLGEMALVASGSDFYAHKRASRALARVEIRAAKVKALVSKRGGPLLQELRSTTAVISGMELLRRQRLQQWRLTTTTGVEYCCSATRNSSLRNKTGLTTDGWDGSLHFPFAACRPRLESSSNSQRSQRGRTSFEVPASEDSNA